MHCNSTDICNFISFYFLSILWQLYRCHISPCFPHSAASHTDTPRPFRSLAGRVVTTLRRAPSGDSRPCCVRLCRASTRESPSRCGWKSGAESHCRQRKQRAISPDGKSGRKCCKYDRHASMEGRASRCYCWCSDVYGVEIVVQSPIKRNWSILCLKNTNKSIFFHITRNCL